MNHLTQETSPYLLQHAANPVHWYGWGPSAFAAARDTDRPILLSSGYAACHWCHVMAHESFENTQIAAFMNEHYINIKLDREERPDVDRLYMAALHAMGEQGGWPLTMFLTPDLKPFWGGTYFPAEPRYGRPGFLQVLTAISNLWNTDRHRAISSGEALANHLRQTPAQSDAEIPTLAEIARAAHTIANACDPKHGGLRGAPKFPQSPLFAFLWQQSHNEGGSPLQAATLKTLEAISQGGIYDHLGGGLSRYSTDEVWLVPHFEKMLYDNAQFISLASRLSHETGNQLLATRVDETANFLLSEMRSEAGLFTSAYDADSEGEEGKYYVWEKQQISQILTGHDATEFCNIYGVTDGGNFEGHNILNRIQHPEPDEPALAKRLALARQELLQERHNRIPPLHDDKSLADWNALAITAFAEAAIAFGNQQWLDAACDAFEASTATFWTGSTLYHSHRAGKTQHLATAHDYAQLIASAITLAGVTGQQRHVETAQTLLKNFETDHWSEEHAGFLLTSRQATDLIANDITIQDDVTPSPNALMIRNYTALYFLTGIETYHRRAAAMLKHHGAKAIENPFAAPSLLAAAAFAQNPWQITLYGVEAPIRHTLLRHALQHTGLDAILIHKSAGDIAAGHFTICRGTVCSLPVSDEQSLADAITLLDAP